MFSLLKKNSAFFIPYLLFLLAGGIALLLHRKVDIASFINQYHNPSADFFFTYWTYIGLGWLYIPMAIICACISRRALIMLSIAFVLTFSINDTTKYFADTLRPLQVFELAHIPHYLVPGVEVFRFHSFPSGHTANSFGLFCLLALVVNNKPVKLFCFLAAFLVGYSRMYLFEHFLVDVYFGSLVGVICAISTYQLVGNWSWLNKFANIDKPLIRL